jgi:putative flippase GtrA
MKQAFFQLMRFGTVGGAHTVLDAGIYFVLTRNVSFFAAHYLYAAAISFFICSLSSFFWNKHWTFKHRVQFHHKQLLRFYMVGIVALVLNQLILWQLVRFELFDLIAKVIASVSAGVCNFLMQKFWAFAHKHHIVEQLEKEYTTFKH